MSSNLIIWTVMISIFIAFNFLLNEIEVHRQVFEFDFQLHNKYLVERAPDLRPYVCIRQLS